MNFFQFRKYGKYKTGGKNTKIEEKNVTFLGWGYSILLLFLRAVGENVLGKQNVICNRKE